MVNAFRSTRLERQRYFSTSNYVHGGETSIFFMLNTSSHRMSTPPDILIYAELLSNIRQVSVGCSLQTPSNSSTKAVISPNGLRLAINHDGVEQFVQLPGQVNPILQLPIPKIGANGLTWRLPLASTTASNGRPSVEDQSVPWSASDLEPGLAIRCRACKAVIVQSDVLTVWKDLPSENWAEMMEFWHCHKPNDHDNHDEENLAQKGYGANSRISAQPGVGFVDLASFLLSESDINDSVVSFFLYLFFSFRIELHGYTEGGQTSVLAHSVAWSPILIP